MSVQLVKELRERTGAGFLDCKKAVEASDGDIDAAIEWLKERGIAKAAKKAGNTSAEGLGVIKTEGNYAVIAEVNSQTDFVAKNAEFLDVLNRTGDALLRSRPENLEAALAADIDGASVRDFLVQATAKIGENIVLRRAETIVKTDSQNFGPYAHNGGKIVVVTTIEGGDSDVAKDVSMHVAAMAPEFYTREEMNDEVLAKMKAEIIDEIKKDESMASKPDNVLDGIAKGRLNKKLSEIVLLDQTFVKATGKETVQNFLDSKGAKLVSVVRYAVGEGIEVETVDFAAEVAAQMAK